MNSLLDKYALGGVSTINSGIKSTYNNNSGGYGSGLSNGSSHYIGSTIGTSNFINNTIFNGGGIISPSSGSKVVGISSYLSPTGKSSLNDSNFLRKNDNYIPMKKYY